MRLEGGRNRFEGKVRVCENGEWRHICVGVLGSDWNIDHGQVVCRSLNYPTTGKVLASNSYVAMHDQLPTNIMYMQPNNSVANSFVLRCAYCRYTEQCH